LVAGSNAVGSQVWNNQVTGGGELQRDGAGGATILNDTNNYTGDTSGENSQGTVIGTLLTDGLLGVGVNSTNDINGNLIGALGSAALAIHTRGSGIFSGTNGTAGLTYVVLSSTNLALALSNWTTVSTNVFGTASTFSVTNPIGAGSKYFVLKVPP
jgi:hypothetical protein